MITISQTYSIVTPESADVGDVAEAGHLLENESVTFGELVAMLRRDGYAVPSESHTDCPRWVSDHGTQDHRTGAYETRSIHIGSDARSLRWWPVALRAAGIKVGKF